MINGRNNVNNPLSGISAQGPDPSWKKLYTAGGIAAFFYLLLSLVIPAVMVLVKHYDFKLGGPAMLEFIAANKAWWTVLQSLVLASSILAIVTFAALFAALKHLDKGLAALGALVAIVLQVLFMAYYPILLGLTNLGGQYTAATGSRRGVLEAAAEALIAQNNAFNPVYESLFAAGVMILSLVMLKGVFRRWAAWLGIAVAPAATIALCLWPLVGVGYFWWWILFLIWFGHVGWKLIRLGNS